MKSTGNAIILVLLTGLAFGTPAFAQDKGKQGRSDAGKPNQIRIEYVEPKQKKHEEIYKVVTERQLLEKFQQFLSPLLLPSPLTLKFEQCDEPNAFYEDGAVEVCYEYLAELIKNAPKKPTRDGVTRQDAIYGPTLEVFLHEIGHAVFDMLKVPVWGREEDAADQLAAFLLLQLGDEQARKMIIGVAYMNAQDARQEEKVARQQKSKSRQQYQRYADEHGLAPQRFYNLLCMAYGAKPELFKDLVAKGYLTEERAPRCQGEYEQVRRAFRETVMPHVDAGLRSRFKDVGLE